MTDPQTTPVPARLLKGPAEGHFVLRVEGDALAERGILDGDLVLVLRQEPAECDFVAEQLWPAALGGSCCCPEGFRHKPLHGTSYCWRCHASLVEPFWRLSRFHPGDEPPAGVVLALIRRFTAAPLPLETTIEVAVGGVV